MPFYLSRKLLSIVGALNKSKQSKNTPETMRAVMFRPDPGEAGKVHAGKVHAFATDGHFFVHAEDEVGSEAPVFPVLIPADVCNDILGWKAPVDGVNIQFEEIGPVVEAEPGGAKRYRARLFSNSLEFDALDESAYPGIGHVMKQPMAEVESYTTFAVDANILFALLAGLDEKRKMQTLMIGFTQGEGKPLLVASDEHGGVDGMAMPIRGLDKQGDYIAMWRRRFFRVQHTVLGVQPEPELKKPRKQRSQPGESEEMQLVRRTIPRLLTLEQWPNKLGYNATVEGGDEWEIRPPDAGHPWGAKIGTKTSKNPLNPGEACWGEGETLQAAVDMALSKLSAQDRCNAKCGDVDCKGDCALPGTVCGHCNGVGEYHAPNCQDAVHVDLGPEPKPTESELNASAKARFAVEIALEEERAKKYDAMTVRLETATRDRFARLRSQAQA